MARFGFLAGVLLLLVCCGEVPEQRLKGGQDNPEPTLTAYVNPLMGTDSEFSFSNGNTYPAIATPWGMHFWTPMTSEMGNEWTYRYDDQKIPGIKQTHQPASAGLPTGKPTSGIRTCSRGDCRNSRWRPNRTRPWARTASKGPFP